MLSIKDFVSVCPVCSGGLRAEFSTIVRMDADILLNGALKLEKELVVEAAYSAASSYNAVHSLRCKVCNHELYTEPHDERLLLCPQRPGSPDAGRLP